MIEARALAKRFGARPAIAGVSFRVDRGEVLGLLGPNGAGKTTTLRILAGVFPPDTGTAFVDGHDLATAPLIARRALGYAPERPAVPLDMTVARFLDWIAAMRDVPIRARAACVAVATRRTALADVGDRRIGALSKGYRQRLGLAAALVGDPPALLLDEPTAGLDPAQAVEARHLVRELGRTHAVLVSSHALADVERMCDRVVILHRGRVLADGPPAALAARLRPTGRIDVEVEGPPEAVATVLGAVTGVATATITSAGADGRTRCRIDARAGADPRPALATAVAQHGWPLYALEPVATSLAEAFLALTGADEDEAP